VTLGALSLTGVERFKTPFGPPAIETRHVSHTNAFRGPEGEDEAAFCARLLAEVEDTVAEVGPDRVAMIIAEPVQNAGGCLVPPAGYWPGLRAIADRHGILLVADEVICGFGRLGEWFGVERFGAVPDLITCAKGLTSGYAPAGAVLASTKVTDHLYSPGTTLMHGITFGGHPLSCALALKSIEIFVREGVLDNVRALEPHLESSLQSLRDLPIVGDVRGAGFFWAVELVRGGVEHRLDAGERERLLKGYLPGRLLEAGRVARADDRGDSVLQIAPPLVATREELDDIVGRMGDVLTDACAVLGLTPTPV
jgi:adenosylmethionine-8-amino-7-oxononanoate aminotransferase